MSGSPDLVVAQLVERLPDYARLILVTQPFGWVACRIERAAKYRLIVLAERAEYGGKTGLTRRERNARYARGVGKLPLVHVDVGVECQTNVVEIAPALHARAAIAPFALPEVTGR